MAKKLAKNSAPKKAKRKATKKKAAKKTTRKKAKRKVAKKKTSPKRAVKKAAVTCDIVSVGGTKETATKKLTKKQDRFCREYIIDFNGTRSAISAAFSKKTAAEQSYQLLQESHIQERLKKLIEERQKRTQTKADDAMNECCRIAFADVGQAFNEDNTLKAIHEMPEDIRRAVSGIEVDEIYSGTGEDRALTGYTKKIKFWSKGRQIEMLFKHHGLFSKDNDQKGKSLAQLISEAVGSDK